MLMYQQAAIFLFEEPNKVQTALWDKVYGTWQRSPKPTVTPRPHLPPPTPLVFSSLTGKRQGNSLTSRMSEQITAHAHKWVMQLI